ncbi:hypothetical protein V6N13_083343 [Hibiscus sabdariffa]
MGLLTAARFFRFCGLECFVEIDFACDSSLDVSFVYGFQVANGVFDALPKDGVDWLFVFQAPTAIVGTKVCQTYGHLYGTRGCGIGGNYFESLIVDRASTSYGQLWILLLVRVKMPRPSIFWASHGEWHYDDDCDDLIQVLQR